MKRLWKLSVLLWCFLFAQQAYALSEPASNPGNGINFVEASSEAAFSKEYVAAEKLLISILIDLDGPVDKKLFSKLKKAVRKAVRAEPLSVDVNLMYATTLWLEARSTGKRMSYLKGLPQKSRDVFEKILEEHPENSRALGSYALWNFDVLRRGGKSGARALGASYENGETMWNRSRELAPDDHFLAIQGAFMLIAFDREQFQSEAIELLTNVAEEEMSSALELALFERGNELKIALQNDDNAEIDRLLKSWIGR